MQIMVVELEDGRKIGRMIEVEDIGIIQGHCFVPFINDGRVVGLAQDADGRNTICIWKKVGDLWKHHFNISMSVDGDGDDLLSIATHNHVMLEMGQPALDKTMKLIVTR